MMTFYDNKWLTAQYNLLESAQIFVFKMYEFLCSFVSSERNPDFPMTTSFFFNGI